MTQLTEQASEIEQLKEVITQQKDDQKKLKSEKAGLEQLNQTIEKFVFL